MEWEHMSGKCSCRYGTFMKARGRLSWPMSTTCCCIAARISCQKRPIWIDWKTDQHIFYFSFRMAGSRSNLRERTIIDLFKRVYVGQPIQCRSALVLCVYAAAHNPRSSFPHLPSAEKCILFYNPDRIFNSYCNIT